MRLLPRSLYGRLLVLSAVATLCALVFAGFAISAVLERFVMSGLDDRLDTQIAQLASAVRPDGTINHARIVLAAPYDDPRSGWTWQILAPHGRLSSPGAPDGMDSPPPDLRPEPPTPDLRDDDDRHEHHPRPFEWRNAHGQAQHARSRSVETTSGMATIIAAAPREIVARPIRAAMTPLLVSLLVLGIALTFATLVQLRLGLRPVTRLRDAVVAIRSGAARHIPGAQPAELAGLVHELNALIDQNEAQLAHARGHVANLAHGIKTPLAALSLKLREGGADQGGALTTEIAKIELAVRHHLGRARTDVSGRPSRQNTPLAPAIEGLAQALSRIHRDRGIAFASDVTANLAIAIDPQDLDELLGNVLDNGWRWARTTLHISAEREAGLVRITITDDGPGIPAAARAMALQPGRRLDETHDGHGFGLSIAREIAELHGGSLGLDQAAAGGLRASITLPSAG